MTSPVLVTGGTGTLGRLVVRRLTDAGRSVRVLSRRDRAAGDGTLPVTGDLLTGEGVAGAVAGVDVIVHCASGNKGDAEATRNLVRAAARAGGEPHVVYVSIVGVDRVPYGYLRGKLDAERIVADSGLPWTILRATQFFDLILSGARKAAWLPVVPVPAGFLVRPVDADEVAARLVELALGEPAGRVPDLGGPEALTAADLIRRYLRATGRRRAVIAVRLPGTARIRAGGLVPSGPGSALGRRTWEQFLAGQDLPVTSPGRDRS
jgi:uncharacterized protein YbjT (DUF2867 family)